MVHLKDLVACGKCGGVYVARIAIQEGHKRCPVCGYMGIHHQLDGSLLSDR